jgi:hypothetical protein
MDNDSTAFDPFDCKLALEFPQRITPAAAWVEHIPFGMSLIELLLPRLVVEMGTYWGDSYCAFCQAVAKLQFDTKCIAVDTWQGDAHTGEYAGILDDLRAHHDPLYSRFSTLKQCTFDDALRDVADASVDLLHIDGLHTYDAVRHDFESWLPKVSDRAVVLFHDTAERTGDFGVWKLWAELAPGYPSFEFEHGHGLGVLAVGPAVPPAMLRFLQHAAAHPQSVRDAYYALGTRAQLYKTANSVLSNLFHAQQSINAVRRADQASVDPATESFRNVQRFPTHFAEFVRKEVERLCKIALKRGGDRAGDAPT